MLSCCVNNFISANNSFNMERPMLGWIYQKSCFNHLKELEMDTNRLSGISPSERLGSMFESGIYSDCSFLVEGEEIRAHKLILAAASPKMEDLFFGAESSQSELVEVPYSKRVMQLILKHVYLQDMDITNIDEAQDVIEAAHYFLMSDLVELCCAGIEPESLDDLWPALNLACEYNSRVLKEACLILALRHSNELLNHSGMINLTSEAFSYILSRDVIHVQSERDIIHVAISWAKNRIENQSTGEETVRTELEKSNILNQLRVLSLSETELLQFFSETGHEIFSETELQELEVNYYSEKCPNFTSALRIPRMLEYHVAICGTDYLSVKNNDLFTVDLKIHEPEFGIRPIIKIIVLPSQINPANILYDNVSHRTHYNEFILAEVSVSGKTIGRGSFCSRIKYGDDVHISINIYNIIPIFTNRNDDYYEVKLRIMFKNEGYYPLAVESKQISSIEFSQPCRFINEFILMNHQI